MEVGSPTLPSQPSGGIESGSRTAFVGSAGAVVIPGNFRKELGIQEGTCLSVYRENDRLVLQPVTNEFIRSLVRCCKGEDPLVEARGRDHQIEKPCKSNRSSAIRCLTSSKQLRPSEHATVY